MFCSPRLFSAPYASPSTLSAPNHKIWSGQWHDDVNNILTKWLVPSLGMTKHNLDYKLTIILCALSWPHQLLQITRTGQDSWDTKHLLSVSFASLQVPHQQDPDVHTHRHAPTLAHPVEIPTPIELCECPIFNYFLVFFLYHFISSSHDYDLACDGLKTKS